MVMGLVKMTKVQRHSPNECFCFIHVMIQTLKGLIDAYLEYSHEI